MDDIYLDIDEDLILKGTDVERYGIREDVLTEMILTNKNLIFVYDYKAGFFSKIEKKADKVPLEKIRVFNDQAQVMQIDHDDYGKVMQIIYTNGTREMFSFDDNKKNIPKWVDAINTAVTGNEAPIIEERASVLLAAKKGLFSLAEKEQANIEATGTSAKKKETAPQGNRGHVFCMSCGEKLTAGAKFCGSCGAPVNQTTSLSNQRQQKFVGMVYKCPNCGSVITKTALVCPDCGMRISKEQGTNILKDFQNKLMELESQKGGFGILKSGNTKKQVALITYHPIPDNVDEIVEFMAYAQAMFNDSDYTDLAIAWYSKVKQLYTKAQLSFPSDPAFADMERMYFDVKRKYLEDFDE